MASNAEEPQDHTTGDLEKAPPVPVKNEDEDEYPPFAKVVIIMIAVYLSMFLVALVRLSDIPVPTYLGAWRYQLTKHRIELF
jgi:hypothetical protein